MYQRCKHVFCRKAHQNKKVLWVGRLDMYQLVPVLHSEVEFVKLQPALVFEKMKDLCCDEYGRHYYHNNNILT